MLVYAHTYTSGMFAVNHVNYITRQTKITHSAWIYFQKLDINVIIPTSLAAHAIHTLALLRAIYRLKLRDIFEVHHVAAVR